MRAVGTIAAALLAAISSSTTAPSKSPNFIVSDASFYCTFNSTKDPGCSSIFQADSGKSTTDGSGSCMRPDHAIFNHPLSSSSGVNYNGLQLNLDNIGATACSSSYQLSIGHLSSYAYYSYGTLEALIRSGHRYCCNVVYNCIV